MAALTLVHLSDFHFGRPLAAAAAAALPAAVAAAAPDAVFFTGDFTQRAKDSQFADALALWRQLPEPRVAAMGNHDVPTYRLHERLLAPFRRYERHVGPTESFVEGPGWAAAFANTNAPWLRMVHGRLRAAQAAGAAERFAAAVPGTLKIFAGHHPFLPPPDHPSWPALPHAEERLATLAEAGVELALGGHWHLSYALPFERGGRRLWVVQAGTATSKRGRGAEAGLQTFNVLRAEPDRFVLTVHAFDAAAGAFVPRPPRDLPRLPA